MSGCASIQSTPPGPCTDARPTERPERDGVVATENDRSRPRLELLDDLRSDPLARRLDLGQESRTLVVDRGRLGHRRLDVPVVPHLEPEALETLLEARVADRRRAHVDTSPFLAEVERRTDDRDLSLPAVRHGEQAY